MSDQKTGTEIEESFKPSQAVPPNPKDKKGETSPEEKYQNRMAEFADMAKTVFYALLIALFIRTVAYQPFNIPSGSMIPTMLIGDYFFVSKFSYGYSKYSFPYGAAPIEGRILEDRPERGDVAVFRLPKGTGEDYIKRIIGLPGDRIQVIRGNLHVNGEPVTRTRLDGYMQGSVAREQYLETLPNGVSYRVIEVNGNRGFFDNTAEYVVPSGHYFGMGDNRDGSLDSRALDKVGYIPADHLIGRAEFIFFSYDPSVARWFEIWKWPLAIRYGRLFNGVE